MNIVIRMVKAFRKSLKNSFMFLRRALKKIIRTKGRSKSPIRFIAEFNVVKIKPTACRRQSNAKSIFLILSFFF